MKTWTFEHLIIWTLEHWNIGTWNLNICTFEHLSIWKLEHLNIWTCEHWNSGTLEHWNIGTLEHLNIRTFEQDPTFHKCNETQRTKQNQNHWWDYVGMKFEIVAIMCSIKCSFRYRNNDVSNKSWGVVGQGLGCWQLGFIPTTLNFIPTGGEV